MLRNEVGSPVACIRRVCLKLTHCRTTKHLEMNERKPSSCLLAPSVSTFTVRSPLPTAAAAVSAVELQPPLCLSSNLSVLEVAKRMRETRADAAILLDSHGHLEGIVSDNDVARCGCYCTVPAEGSLAVALLLYRAIFAVCFVFALISGDFRPARRVHGGCCAVLCCAVDARARYNIDFALYLGASGCTVQMVVCMLQQAVLYVVARVLGVMGAKVQDVLSESNTTCYSGRFSRPQAWDGYMRAGLGYVFRS